MLKQIIKYGILKATSQKERFDSEMTASNESVMNIVQTENFSEMISNLVSFLLVLLILTSVGKYLWNYVLAGEGRGATGLFTGVKKVDSIIQILALFLIIGLFTK